VEPTLCLRRCSCIAADSDYIPTSTWYEASQICVVGISGFFEGELEGLTLYDDIEAFIGKLLRQTSDYVLLCVLVELRLSKRRLREREYHIAGKEIRPLGPAETGRFAGSQAFRMPCSTLHEPQRVAQGTSWP
jgi:hypothetical protein